MQAAAAALHKLLEIITVALMLGLAAIVVVAVFCRYVLNDSLPWYDEVASVLLAWITYYGAALAALKRSHLGFSAFVLGLRPVPRAIVFVLGELVVYAVFVALAWAGWRVLAVMDGMSLESLQWASLEYVQSIVPIGCALFVLAQALSTPLAWERIASGRDAEIDEIQAEIARSRGEAGGPGAGERP
jgi:TRAP-type C4-dicarboxylate transport system permease small subunit